MKYLFLLFFSLFIMSANAQWGGSKRLSTDDKKTIGTCLTIGGVGFTLGAILDGGSQYGTYVNSSSNTMGSSPSTTYVTPPIWRQTPRNIMFVAGFGLTITGLITALSK